MLFQNKKGRLSRSSENVLLPPLLASPCDLSLSPRHTCHLRAAPYGSLRRLCEPWEVWPCLVYLASWAQWVTGSMCSILTGGMNVCKLLALRKSHFCMTVLALTCYFSWFCDNSETLAYILQANFAERKKYWKEKDRPRKVRQSIG